MVKTRIAGIEFKNERSSQGQAVFTDQQRGVLSTGHCEFSMVAAEEPQSRHSSLRRMDQLSYVKVFWPLISRRLDIRPCATHREDAKANQT